MSDQKRGRTEPSPRVYQLGQERASALEQRKAEALVLYSHRPPAQPIAKFCREHGIDKKRWYAWLDEPAFSAEIDRIDRKRRKISLGILDRNLDRMLRHFVDATLASDDPAKGVRLALEALGVIGPRGAQTVNVAVQQTTSTAGEQLAQDPARMLRLYTMLRDYGPGIFGCSSWQELEQRTAGSLPSAGGAEAVAQAWAPREIEVEVVSEDPGDGSLADGAPMASEDD